MSMSDAGTAKPLEIIDLLENDSSSEDEGKDYFYFLAKKHGKYLVDPLAPLANQEFDFGPEQAEDSAGEHDSEDSNRESAD